LPGRKAGAVFDAYAVQPGREGVMMKNTKGYLDLGSIFDEIFEATQNFQDEFHRNFTGFAPGMRGGDGLRWAPGSHYDENTDYYPAYSYPPMNAYMTADRSLVFEFALAGFDEKDINLSFQGDYMVFSAALPRGESTALSEDEAENFNQGNVRYFKHRLKMKDIEKQKYFVPLDKYAQEKVKAVYKNGILKVTVPPKEEPDQNEGVKIEIINED
jgi:HSP20 family molecular chaperone IbpA